jgi:hypothetical protein
MTIKNTDRLLIALFIGYILVCLFGCNASKQATKHYNKALNKDTATVAALCDKYFPAVVVKSDTVTYFDFIEIECPPAEDGVKTIPIITKIDPDKLPKNDKAKIVNSKVPVKTDSGKVIIPVPKTTITDTKKSTAEVKACEGEKEKLTKEKDKQKDGKETWRTIALTAIGLLGIIIWLFIQEKRKRP